MKFWEFRIVLSGSDRTILTFCASPEGRTGVSSYTGEGRHLGGIIGIPWPGSEAGLGVLTFCTSQRFRADNFLTFCTSQRFRANNSYFLHITAILLYVRSKVQTPTDSTCSTYVRLHVCFADLNVVSSSQRFCYVRAWQNVKECCGIYVRDMVALLAWQDVLPT